MDRGEKLLLRLVSEPTESGNKLRSSPDTAEALRALRAMSSFRTVAGEDPTYSEDAER